MENFNKQKLKMIKIYMIGKRKGFSKYFYNTIA